MAMPDRIGGRDDEGEKRPKVVVAFGLGKKPPRVPDRIGGSDDYDDEPEGNDERISNDQAKDDATDELISALSDMKPSRKRVKAALTAFFYACDAEPHDEGEHTEEEGDE